MAVKPIPKGYHTVTPYLTVRDAPKVIEFLKQAFGAKLSHEMKRPDGPATVMHAEIVIGDFPGHDRRGKRDGKGNAIEPLHLRSPFPHVDSVYRQAIKAGGSNVMEPMDMFYGDRSGGVKDPSGNSWFIATHKRGRRTEGIGKTRRSLQQAEGQSRIVALEQDDFSSVVIPPNFCLSMAFKARGPLLSERLFRKIY